MIINPHFSSLWNRSSEEEQNKVQKMVLDGDRDGLAGWIKNHPDKELGEKNSIQLKKIARELGIKNYSRMDKSTLISSIQQINNKTEAEPNEDPTEMLTVMFDLINEMEPLLIEAKVTNEYFSITDRVIELDNGFIQEAYDWLLKSYTGVYKNAYDIKKLLPQETWDRYRGWAMFGEHREVELLEKELKRVRRVFVSAKRPTLFKQTAIKKILDRIDAEKEKNEERVRE